LVSSEIETSSRGEHTVEVSGRGVDDGVNVRVGMGDGVFVGVRLAVSACVEVGIAVKVFWGDGELEGSPGTIEIPWQPARKRISAPPISQFMIRNSPVRALSQM
jgi:hypothetical protein